MPLIKNHTVACLLLFLCSMVCFGQANRAADSLRSAIYATRTDTSRVNAINALSRQFLVTGDFDSAIHYNKQAFVLSQKTGFKKGLAVNYTYFGLVYYAWGNYAEVLKNYYATLKIREELNDKAGMAATYHNIGNMYYQQGNPEEAMKNFQLSLKIKRETGDTLDSHYAHTINNLGNFYEGKANFANAMKYYEAALRIEKKIGDVLGMISAYGNIANVYISVGDYEKAFKNYFIVLRLSDSIGDKQSLAAIYNNLGNLCYKTGKYKEALEWLYRGLELSKQIGSMDDVKEAYGHLTEVNAKLGRYREALNEYKMWVAYRDSLTNEETTKKMVRAQMNYEFERKEAAARLEQEKKEAIAATEKKKQRFILVLVSCFLVLVAGFAIFAYRSYLQKQKANLEITQQKEIIEEKQKAILDSIHYAKRIQTALLTSEVYIKRQIDRLLK